MPQVRLRSGVYQNVSGYLCSGSQIAQTLSLSLKWSGGLNV
jgi:hypothetical protein